MEVSYAWPYVVEKYILGSDAGAEWQINEQRWQKTLSSKHPQDGLLQIDPLMVNSSSLYRR